MVVMLTEWVGVKALAVEPQDVWEASSWDGPGVLADVLGAGRQAAMEEKLSDATECWGVQTGHLVERLAVWSAPKERLDEWEPGLRWARRGSCQDWFRAGLASWRIQSRCLHGWNLYSRFQPLCSHAMNLSRRENRDRDRPGLPTDFRARAGAAAGSNRDAIDSRGDHYSRCHVDRGRRFDCVRCGDGGSSGSTSRSDGTHSDAASRSPCPAMNQHGSQHQM